MKINYAVPFFNTVTCLPAKMDTHQPRSCLDILSRTHSPHTVAPSRQKSTQEAEQQATETLEQSKTFYNIHARSLPDIRICSPVALQSQQTKLWDVYGTVVAIGPHRRYYVKTHSGRVLVRNRRFLRRRIPASLQPLAPVCHPSTPNQHTSPPATSTPLPASPESTIHTRHSLRPRRPPLRLVEDPNWP